MGCATEQNLPPGIAARCRGKWLTNGIRNASVTPSRAVPGKRFGLPQRPATQAFRPEKRRVERTGHGPWVAQKEADQGRLVTERPPGAARVERGEPTGQLEKVTSGPGHPAVFKREKGRARGLSATIQRPRKSYLAEGAHCLVMGRDGKDGFGEALRAEPKLAGNGPVFDPLSGALPSEKGRAFDAERGHLSIWDGHKSPAHRHCLLQGCGIERRAPASDTRPRAGPPVRGWRGTIGAEKHDGLCGRNRQAAVEACASVGWREAIERRVLSGPASGQDTPKRLRRGWGCFRVTGIFHREILSARPRSGAIHSQERRGRAGRERNGTWSERPVIVGWRSHFPTRTGR
jgi:hypothetical protein